jgi:hypothetical protein
MAFSGCPAKEEGSLVVTIAPQAAVDAGAQWSIDGAAWCASADTVGKLAPGNHTVTFTDMAGWVTPASQTVVVTAGQTITATATYATPGASALVVNITPQGAADAGAQWQLDGGAWQNSGAALSPVSSGIHTVSFKDIPAWANPGNQPVTIQAGQTTIIAGNYSSLAAKGALIVTIEPEAARKASAQWRLDDGIWHQSGEELIGIPVGKHIIHFSEALASPGMVRPNNISVDVDTDPTVTVTGTYTPLLVSDSLVVFGYNDLGMHCMNQDFSEFMILPPYNTLHALVVDRSGPKPQIVQQGIDIKYSIPSKTTSANKTNFWDYAQDLFGLAAPLPPDVGLTGNGLAGTMTPLASEGRSDWSATGIPVTPLADDMTFDPFALGLITVSRGGADIVQTQAVVPVSWELSCQLCHNTPGMTVGQDILAAHDRLHGTSISFASAAPVACGGCHPQPELGFEGDVGMPTLSSSMHTAHAKRMWRLGKSLENGCYACHPGGDTQCQRDVHRAAGMICTDCHGSMEAVGNPARAPWADEPRCGDCHNRAGFEFEQTGTLFRDSKGHYGIHCSACHGSPHTITPTVSQADNVEAVGLQGRTGPISKCEVCHSDPTAGAAFDHRFIAPTP